MCGRTELCRELSYINKRGVGARVRRARNADSQLRVDSGCSKCGERGLSLPGQRFKAAFEIAPVHLSMLMYNWPPPALTMISPPFGLGGGSPDSWETSQ